MFRHRRPVHDRLDSRYRERRSRSFSPRYSRTQEESTRPERTSSFDRRRHGDLRRYLNQGRQQSPRRGSPHRRSPNRRNPENNNRQPERPNDLALKPTDVFSGFFADVWKDTNAWKLMKSNLKAPRHMFIAPSPARALNAPNLPNGSICRSLVVRFNPQWFIADINAMTQEQNQAPAHVENNQVLANATQAIERLITTYVPARVFVCLDGNSILDAILSYMCTRKNWVPIMLNPPGFKPINEILDDREKAEAVSKRIKKALNMYHPLSQDANFVPNGQGFLVDNLP